MSWFHRSEEGIKTPTNLKKEIPEGLWFKTPSGEIVHKRILLENNYVAPEDGHHFRIGSAEYFSLLFNDTYEELDIGLTSGDPLDFVDRISYVERVQKARAATGLDDAVRTAVGSIADHDVVVACMDFTFIGGSMGSVVGEKISRAAQAAYERRLPFLVICKSGGARMMEAGFSLMQMPKILAKLVQLSQNKLPYLTLLTDPTTGGVSASFGMLGDIIMAEPNALIGFAGPRVIRETIGKDLPKRFQRAEFLLEKGFIDFIVDRRELKKQLDVILRLLKS